MLSPSELYPLVLAWLQALEITRHPTAQAALTHLLTALLLGQSLRPSALMRALLSPTAVPARQRYKRVRRTWDRRWLTPAWLTPRLVRAALALVAPDRAGTPTAGLTHLALDSVRCGAWELFTLGVVWHGRVLVVGWAVLPYPWPKGRFTPTVCALVERVAAAWPADRPAHLLADRAFPSRPLFRTLRQLGWGWTVRLRAKNWVTVANRPRWVRALLAGARVGCWTAYPDAAYGSGPPAIPGTLVVGRGLAVLPARQRGEGSLRRRARQQAKRRRHLATKHAGRTDASAETDAWLVLFTSHASWLAAQASYGRRWATEGSYRDAQGGWDGRHGWDLEPVVARLRTAAEVEALAGLWALGMLLQTWVGHQVGRPRAPSLVRAIRREWTTTGRLSVWARGRLALTEPSGRLRGWLRASLSRGARRIATAPPLPPRVVRLPLRRQRPPRTKVA
jgi:hypothetical protein